MELETIEIEIDEDTWEKTFSESFQKNLKGVAKHEADPIRKKTFIYLYAAISKINFADPDPVQTGAFLSAFITMIARTEVLKTSLTEKDLKTIEFLLFDDGPFIKP
jgi:hypothetical protein